MGILDDTLAAFGSRASGAGPASGVNYFASSNFAPGLDNIAGEQIEGNGIQQVQSSSFGGRAPQEPGRDLTQNPLTEGELRGLRGVQAGLSVLPFGQVLSAGIDYNMGQDAATNGNPLSANRSAPDNMAGRAGYMVGLGATGSEAAKGALATSTIGRMAGMNPGRTGYIGQNFGWQNPTGFNGLGVTGYEANPQEFVPGQEVVNDADIVENGPDGYSSGSSYRPRDNESQRGPGGSSGDAAAAAAGANAAGPGMADGGIVGLSGPRYADGGAVTPMLSMGFADGGNIEGSQPSPETVNQQVSQILRNPQMRQRIVAGAQQLMQTGELTPQEVTTMGQIAEASMQNPALYPKLRQFVAQQGMSPLPPSFDPSVIVKILAISRALAQSGGGTAAPGGPGMTPPGQVPPTDQAQMQNPAGMANGGFLQGPGTGRSDSIGTVNESTGQPVRVANGEYVIPEHVVRAKGRDFFDKMLRQYAQVNGEGDKA